MISDSVDYGSDLPHVERVVTEVGREVMTAVPGGVKEFEPFIRYHTFADSSINFTVILRAQEFVDQYVIKHEFIKRLHARFDQEHITITFPIRTVLHRSFDRETARWGVSSRPGNQRRWQWDFGASYDDRRARLAKARPKAVSTIGHIPRRPPPISLRTLHESGPARRNRR